MTTLDQVSEEYKDGIATATHLLLIGNTKSGKTDYCAQAARDGFNLIYIDSDNGMSTLLHVLRNEPEAMKRVHYFRPADYLGFVKSFLTLPEIRYNNRTRGIWISSTPSNQDTDQITVIRPTRVPKDTILVLDGWSSLAYAAAEAAAKSAQVDLLDIAKYGREIYGPAGYQLSAIAQVLQGVPYHLIVQAHPSVYERKEKPAGNTQEDITEKMMIIKETTQVPLSSSGPHGATLGKFFNQIGWMYVDKFDNRKLDFKTVNGRIGGGTPGGIGNPRAEYSFAKLFARVATVVATPINPERPWIENISHVDLKERLKPAAKAVTPITKPATPTAPVTTPATPVTIGTAPKLGVKFSIPGKG